MQVKPVPRKARDGEKKDNEYQVFVKANFARVKMEMESRGLETQMGKVMEAVAKEYREEKERRSKAEVDEVELAFGGLNIGDE